MANHIIYTLPTIRTRFTKKRDLTIRTRSAAKNGVHFTYIIIGILILLLKQHY